MSPSAERRRLAYFAWGAVCLIWGTTYLGIRISLESIPPALMGGLRWTIAGSLLTLYLVVRGRKLPAPSTWPGTTLLAFLLLGLGNGGVVFAEQWVPSGLAAVLVATSPFWMAGVEACLPDGERLRQSVLAGLVIGFSGIVLLVWPDLTLENAGGRGFLAGVVALQIASMGWSIGSSYSKRQGRPQSGSQPDQGSADEVLGTTAFQMLAGGLMMMIAGTVLGEWSQLSFTARTGTALIYLATIGAIGGFVAYTYALRHLPVSFVSLYAYINPVIAVALGVLVLREPFTWRMAVAAALVFVGVAVVRWRPAAVVTSVSTPEAARRVACNPWLDASPADESHQEQHDGNHQQHIDEIAHRVAAHQTQQPQNDQDDRDGLEHFTSPLRP
jgi:drug/metabolite transporter (DMT)-like permease